MSKRAQVLLIGWIYQIVLILIVVSPAWRNTMSWLDWAFWGIIFQDLIITKLFMFHKSGRERFLTKTKQKGILI